MNIISIDEENIDAEHICCAIGNDKDNRLRADSKKAWMKERFRDGLAFKRLDERGKVFIEYMPVEKAWKPVVGKNWMLINCLWVSGKFKGQGISTMLVNECVKDSKKLGMDGVVAVVGVKTMPFLTDKTLYAKHGFVTVDSAPPYFELMALSFGETAKVPAFTETAKSGVCGIKKGLAFVYSNQCPFMEEYVAHMTDWAGTKGVSCTAKKLMSSREAKEWGSPFGTLGIYYDGKFKAHELMPEAKFMKFLGEL